MKINYVSTEAPAAWSICRPERLDIILANFTVTDERKEQVDFALPYMNVALGVVSHEDHVIKDLDEVQADEQVIVISGTTAETYLTKNYPDISSEIRHLCGQRRARSRTEPALPGPTTTQRSLSFAAENKGYTVGIESLGEKDTIAPAVTKGNKSLLDEINNEITSLGKENFFHKDYEETLAETYGSDYEETLVIEGGKTK